jgi:hypothetical protein
MSTVNKTKGEKARIRKATRKSNQQMASLVVANKAIAASLAPSDLVAASAALVTASETLQTDLAAYRATL